ncbi:hypothetical protein [Kutzneria buriramensis]|nr:hypothetical protein [Kutzneria buriramensis]
MVISVLNGWTPVLDLSLAAGAPVAGLYPALWAARTEPVDALRGGGTA